MSEKKKKVIYVKDLVIKADNVTIDPSEPRRRPFDPFFGPVREEAVEEKKEEKVEDIEDVEEDKHDDDKHDDDDRRPFSWV